MIYRNLTFEKGVFENSILKLQFWGLRIFGCILCKEDNFKILHIMKMVVNVGVLLLGLIVEVTFLTQFPSRIEQATLAVAIFIIYSNILIKSFFFCFYSKAYSELINHVQINMVYLQRQIDQSGQLLFSNFIQGTRRINNVIMVLICSSAVVTISEGIGYSIIHYNDIKMGNFRSNASLPIIFVMVPSWVISRNFFVTYILPCYMEFLGGLGLFVWTTFNTSLMRYAAFRLDFINFRLQYLTDFNEKHTKAFLADFVREVIFVKDFVKKYEKVSRIPLFIDTSSSTALMCMLMYQVSQVKEYANAFVVLPAIFGLFGMLFVYYWNANEISVKSDKLSTSIYMSDWYGLPVALQKSVLLFMKGCINPITLKVVLYSMNTETFVVTLKTSYSFFTLLTNLANKN